MTLHSVLLTFFVLMVCYCDLVYKKIFNWLTIPFLLIAFIINCWLAGIGGLYESALGMLTGFAILLLPYCWGWVGGGDVKLLTAVGAFGGALFVAKVTMEGLIIFGIVAMFYLLVRGKFEPFIQQLIILWMFGEKRKILKSISCSGSLPLGFFLGISSLLNWFCGN